jgi:hypothetical protein
MPRPRNDSSPDIEAEAAATTDGWPEGCPEPSGDAVGWPYAPAKTAKKKMPGAPNPLTMPSNRPRPAWMSDPRLLPKRPPTVQHAFFDLPVEDRRTPEQKTRWEDAEQEIADGRYEKP